ncbi:MAG: glycosyltransferase family 25 protein [Pasteurellaceae bacterium]|nr:glycosyltransferase family 25 protein [Pasteurellaceae bacterium]
MLQGYVINLDRHPERLFTFYQQPEARLFQRMPAVDKQILALLGNGDLLFDIASLKRNIQRPVTLGEIGCTLSHLKVWQAIANNTQIAEHDFALVAEDDIRFIPHFDQYLVSLVQSISQQALDIVLLHKLGLYIEGNLPRFSGGGGTLHYFIPTLACQCDNDGSALYLIRKAKAKSLVSELASRKPDWLADQFSAFCELDRIAILSHQFGYIEENSSSDLEQERNIARQQSL